MQFGASGLTAGVNNKNCTPDVCNIVSVIGFAIGHQEIKMVKRDKPTTPQERQADIENHPERGKFKTEDGRLIDAVGFKSVEIKGAISSEAYSSLLEIWGAKGLSKTDGIQDMVNSYIADLGNWKLVERREQVKSDTYDLDKREVRSKIKGAYKRRAREGKAKFDSGKTGRNPEKQQEDLADDSQP